MKSLWLCLLFFIFASMNFAQTNGRIHVGAKDYSGSCSPNGQIAYNVSDRKQFACSNGSWFSSNAVLPRSMSDFQFTGTPTVSCSVGNIGFQTDATPGNNIWLCTATNTWTQLSSGNTSNNVQVVTYSATPTFNLSMGDQSITLTGDVTSSTLSNIRSGQLINFQVCQDSIGGHTFTWPKTVVGGITISTAASTANANTCTTQVFKSFDGQELYAVSLGDANQPIPATSTPSTFAYVNGIHNSLLTAGNNTATLNWTPSVGDALVVSIDCYGGSTQCAVATISDNQSNTYSLLGTNTHGSGIISALYCGTITHAASGMTVTAAFTTQSTGSDSDINVDDYSGVSCTPDGSVVTGTDGGNLTTTYTAGPLTTTHANDLLVAYGTSSQGNSPTAGTGFTMRQNTGTAETFGYEDRTVLATGSYTFTETTSTATTWGITGAALPITGTLSPTPGAALSPTSLTFLSQTTGTTSAAQVVTLTNTGTAALSISSIAASGVYKQTNNCGTSLAAGTSCSINVKFAPTVAGTITGTLTVRDSAPNSPQSASLSGTATNPSAPAFAFINSIHQSNAASGDNVATLNWTPTVGDILIASLDCYGATTACNVGTLTDSSGNTYTQVATTSHGAAPGVLVSMYCAVVSSSAAGMTVDAAFTNQATGGDSDLTVAEYAGITSCANDGTVVGSDGGTTSNTFSAGPLTTKNANDLLVGYGTSSQGTSPTAGTGFTMRQNVGTAEYYGYEDMVAAATGSYTFTETTSTATTWGMIGAAFPIAGSVSSAPVASLSLMSLSFPSQATGTTSSAQVITLTNTGTATLNISGFAITGQFGQTHTCGTTLAVNTSCTISVTFSPTSTGTLTGTLTITDTAGNSPQTVSLSGTGSTTSSSTNTPDAGAIQLSAISGCGSAGTGGNDTTCIQNAINQSGSQSKQVEIPSGTYKVDPLSLATNTNIFLDSGATIQATTTGYSNSGAVMVSGSGVSNVTIKGASAANSIFKMNKASYDDGSEYRHCMALSSVSTATINGISCNDSGGDGMYINGSSNNITIQNSTFNNNSRNGMSVISVNGLLVDNSTFSNTVGNQTHGANTGSAPDGPWDGIDFEPNGGTDQLKNIVIQNSFMTGNGRPCPSGENCTGQGHGGNGIMVQDNNMLAAAGPISVTINNVQTSGNLSSGFLVMNNPTPVIGGSVIVENCTSTNDGQWGVVLYFWDYRSGGVTLQVQNNTIINPQRSYNGTNVDNAAIGATAGGGDSNAFGNVTITGNNVTYSGGKAFDITPYQTGGDRAITVGSFGTLTGLASGAIGYYNGNPVNSISVP